MKARKVQGGTTLGELDDLIIAFLRAHDWDDLSERSVAISMVLEAGELLEHYQWQDEPVGDKNALADELADVIICAFEFAQITGIDIAEAVKTKLVKNGEKYPAEHFKGKGREGRRKAWLEAKLNHRKSSL